MNTNRFTNLATAAFALIVVPASAFARDSKASSTVRPPTFAVTSITVTDAKPGPVAAMQVAAAPGPEVAPADWNEIKDCTYETRARLFAGLKQLEAKVDDQVRELVAKRATMKGITDTKEWDFAMKEMKEARSYLQSTGEELAKATRETWDQAKDKVGLAWVRVQDAYAKVKSSTTT